MHRHFSMDGSNEIKTSLIPKRKKNIRNKYKVTLLRIKRRISKHVWFIRSIFVVCMVVFIAGLLLLANFFLDSLGFGQYKKLIKNFIFTPMAEIKSTQGRTNILILGKGGGGHEAPELTDTMIFMSVSHNKNDLVLVSLPRDIWIPSLRAKLNSTYYWGNKKSEDGGMVLAKATVEEIVGQPIHYALVLDFEGLKKIIDFLGEIDVEVETSFTDNKYPIAGKEGDFCGGDPELKCRYETVTFEKGLSKMNGDTALKFVRSRNAEGDEGTDFARSKRQQKVLEGIQKKLLTTQILLNTSKIKELIALYETNTETDLPHESSAILARRLYQTKDKKKSYVLGEEFLENPAIGPKYDRLYVFIPKEGDWSKVRQWVGSLLN